MKLFAALFTTIIPFFVFPQLTYTYNAGQNKHYIYNDGQLLAIYNNSGNTFTTFMYKGKNVLGGFSSGTPGTNVGGPIKGHSTDYPYGWIDGGGNKPIWEGFWCGFAYMDTRTSMWEGIAGNPFAQQSFSITQICPKLLDMHSVMIVGPQGNALFQCDVHYYVSPAGIGVYNKTTLLRYIQPVGYDDTGGQFMMTQVDCDLDPSKAYNSTEQTDLYFKLACDAHTENINPFSPYNNITPSNIYADQNITSPPGNVVHPLPNTALVSTANSFSILTPYNRPDSTHNVALRVDVDNSTIPPLEYYCEYNGERDYLNYLFSAAIGSNRTVKTVNGGTIWSFYGDMLPWQGTNPSYIYNIPLLYNYTINKPVITKTGDTLRSSPSQSYQWLFNSSPLSNETKQFFVPTVSGNYSVIVTDTNTLCSDTSDSFPINISEIKTQQLHDNFNISPNPCNKEVNVQFPLESKSEIIITMYDLLFNKSSVVYQNKSMNTGTHKLNLKVNDFSNGIYILKIQTNKSTYARKVIICRN